MTLFVIPSIPWITWPCLTCSSVRYITGMLRISGDRIDSEEIGRWAVKLGYAEIWQAILQKMASVEK